MYYNVQYGVGVFNKKKTIYLLYTIVLHTPDRVGSGRVARLIAKNLLRSLRNNSYLLFGCILLVCYI